MKKTNYILVSSILILLSGCAANKPKIESRVDQEPQILGTSVSQQVTESNQAINDQLRLLNKVQKSEKLENIKIVEHNNNLDARKGSTNTIPLAYAQIKPKQEEVKQVTKEVKQVTKEVKVEKSLLDNKIKHIEWKNESLNKLISNFAKSINYKVSVITTDVFDKNIDFEINDMTIRNALSALNEKSNKFADIKVSESLKTITVIYK